MYTVVLQFLGRKKKIYKNNNNNKKIIKIVSTRLYSFGDCFTLKSKSQSKFDYRPSVI